MRKHEKGIDNLPCVFLPRVSSIGGCLFVLGPMWSEERPLVDGDVQYDDKKDCSSAQCLKQSGYECMNHAAGGEIVISRASYRGLKVANCRART